MIRVPKSVTFIDVKNSESSVQRGFQNSCCKSKLRFVLSNFHHNDSFIYRPRGSSNDSSIFKQTRRLSMLPPISKGKIVFSEPNQEENDNGAKKPIKNPFLKSQSEKHIYGPQAETSEQTSKPNSAQSLSKSFCVPLFIAKLGWKKKPQSKKLGDVIRRKSCYCSDCGGLSALEMKTLDLGPKPPTLNLSKTDKILVKSSGQKKHVEAISQGLERKGLFFQGPGVRSVHEPKQFTKEANNFPVNSVKVKELPETHEAENRENTFEKPFGDYITDKFDKISQSQIVEQSKTKEMFLKLDKPRSEPVKLNQAKLRKIIISSCGRTKSEIPFSEKETSTLPANSQIMKVLGLERRRNIIPEIFSARQARKERSWTERSREFKEEKSIMKTSELNKANKLQYSSCNESAMIEKKRKEFVDQNATSSINKLVKDVSFAQKGFLEAYKCYFKNSYLSEAKQASNNKYLKKITLSSIFKSKKRLFENEVKSSRDERTDADRTSEKIKDAKLSMNTKCVLQKKKQINKTDAILNEENFLSVNKCQDQ